MGSIPADAPVMNGHTGPMLGGKFKVLTSTDQIKELQTIIRDKDTITRGKEMEYFFRLWIR